MALRFPNETPAYRTAGDALLRQELALRRQMESVSVELRALPQGGEVPEDCAFDAIGPDGRPSVVRLSALFRGGDTLMAYPYMFPRHPGDDRPGPPTGPLAGAPLAQGPCPSCTALIDGWDGAMPHFEALGGNLVIVTRVPIERAAAFARDRGWRHVRLVSAARNGFRRDYGGDGVDGSPVPMMTVFHRAADGVIRLHWASELIHAPTDPGQDMHHPGTVEPLWTLFDLTPRGRPKADEQLDYARCCGRAA